VRSDGHYYSWLEFRLAHDKVLAEHYKTSDTLKTTTADNRVLISQHKNALQREREQWNNHMAEQERELEKYRNEMALEVAREKDKQQYLENEKYWLVYFINYNLSLPGEILYEKVGDAENFN